MNEPYQTMAEIEAKYPNEWVLVDKLKKGRDGFAVGGVVVAHGLDKERVLEHTEVLPKPVDIAFYYTRTSMSGLILSRLGYTEPPPSERRTVRTGTGATRAGLVARQLLRGLGQSRSGHPVLLLPHPPGGLIDGLLGLDFFRGLILTLDFAQGQVSLREPKSWWQFWRSS